MITNLKFELDQELLQKKANEFAEQAFLEELKNYYSGYNSPFRKTLQAEFQKKEVSVHFELPDILQTINDAISKEHEEIIKNFIDSTVLVDLRRSLKLQPKEILFSEFLKEVMEADFNYDYDYLDDYEVEHDMSRNRSCTIKISYKNQKIEVRLQNFDGEQGYKFVGNPYISSTNSQSGILNRIQSYLLSLLISGTYITKFDVDYFDEIFENYND